MVVHVNAFPVFIGCPGRMKTGSDSGNRTPISDSFAIFRIERIAFDVLVYITC